MLVAGERLLKDIVGQLLDKSCYWSVGETWKLFLFACIVIEKLTWLYHTDAMWWMQMVSTVVLNILALWECFLRVLGKGLSIKIIYRALAWANYFSSSGRFLLSLVRSRSTCPRRSVLLCSCLFAALDHFAFLVVSLTRRFWLPWDFQWYTFR